eukprot:XP_001701710.1 predicted protein [Chlamydomonas reinhardtii]
MESSCAVLQGQQGGPVFEASPVFRTQGSGVLIQTNGARALQAIHPGLMHRLAERGAITSGVYQYNDVSGERLPWTTQKARPYHCWGQPADSSAAARPPGLLLARYRRILEFGCKVTHADMDAEPAPQGAQEAGQPQQHQEEGQAAPGAMAQLTLSRTAASGGEAEEVVLARARHVIAADGYFSRVRRTVCAGGGSDPAALAGEMPAFMGVALWRGSITRAELAAAGVPLPACLDPAHDSEALRRTHMWSPATPDSPLRGPPSRGLLIYPARNTAGPVGSGGSQALAAAVSAMSSFLTPDVAALLAATPGDRVTGHGLYVHPVEGFTPGAWVRDRLVLVGDAAHTAPPDGQGANLALEDAAVLGACVRKHGLGPEAFAAWEAARQPRAAAILGDPTPAATIRTPLINDATFERLWSPAELLAEERALQAQAAAGVGGGGAAHRAVEQEDVGRLPPDVVASLERILGAEAAAGASASKAAEVTEAGASACEAEQQAVAVVQEWSADVVGRLVRAKVEGRTMAVRVPPPEGTYFVR